jgi:hypothetical protein
MTKLAQKMQIKSTLGEILSQILARKGEWGEERRWKKE